MIETGELNPKIVIEITLQGEKGDLYTIFRAFGVYERELSEKI